MDPTLAARLRKEHTLLERLAQDCPQTWQIMPIQWARVLNGPPVEYRIRLAARGIAKIDAEEEPVYSFTHQFRLWIPLTLINPRGSEATEQGLAPGEDPKVHAETPLWHPQVHRDNLVCINEFNMGSTLKDVVSLLWSLVTYSDFHDDPGVYPGVAHLEAAQWCQKYRANRPNAFPLDQEEVPNLQDLLPLFPIPRILVKPRNPV